MKDLDLIEAQLARVLGFFPRVEARISGLFAANAALIAIAALNVAAGDFKHWYVGISAAALIALLLGSFYFLYRAHCPDVRGGQGSLIYFGEIQKRTEMTFITDYLAIDDDAYRKDLLGQVWRNSQILHDKYIAVTRSIYCTTAAVLPFVIFLGATAIVHSRLPVWNS